MKKLLGSAVMLFLSIFLALVPIKTSVAAETGPFYVGVVGGYAFGSEIYLEGDGIDRTEDLKATWTLGAKFGYVPPFAQKYFAVEFEYLYLKPDIDAAYVTYSGDVTMHNFMLNFLGRYPLGTFTPYLGAGIGASRVEFNATQTGGVPYVQTVSETATGFAWQILAGVNYEITKNWSADLTYRYFMSYPGFDEGVNGEIKTSMITIGINYHF